MVVNDLQAFRRDPIKRLLTARSKVRALVGEPFSNRGISADNPVNAKRREFTLPAFCLFRNPRKDLRRVGRFVRVLQAHPLRSPFTALVPTRAKTLALSRRRGFWVNNLVGFGPRKQPFAETRRNDQRSMLSVLQQTCKSTARCTLLQCTGYTRACCTVHPPH